MHISLVPNVGHTVPFRIDGTSGCLDGDFPLSISCLANYRIPTTILLYEWTLDRITRGVDLLGMKRQTRTERTLAWFQAECAYSGFMGLIIKHRKRSSFFSKIRQVQWQFHQHLNSFSSLLLYVPDSRKGKQKDSLVRIRTKNRRNTILTYTQYDLQTFRPGKRVLTLTSSPSDRFSPFEPKCLHI